MSDIAIAWNDLGGDIALDGPDLATDSGLRTAVVLSLFLDGRARRPICRTRDRLSILPETGQFRPAWRRTLCGVLN